MSKTLEIVHPNAAGIDIGSRNFFVDAGEDQIRIFPTFTADCNAIRDYLLSLGINTVAMESTGVYWITLYTVLEEAGVEVYLVNGRDVKNVPGRKSDVKDCQWLRQLHGYGLLRKSFIPEIEMRKVRSYLRLRQDHIRAAATQVHLMQKALTQMNIRFTEVINDISGASGIRMITAILGGERDAITLAELCHERILEKKRDLVIKSLEGHYSEEHLFALRQAYGTCCYYNSLIKECDAEIERQLKDMSKDKDDIETAVKRKPIRYHKPEIDNLHKPLLKLTGGKDPIGIAGITDYSFLQIVSEVGTDMSPWPTEKHFSGWLKLAPMKSSSGKMHKRVRMKRQNNAGLIFRNLAQGLLNSKHLALGAFGRRIRARRGSPIAIKAIARKIACYYYRVMTNGSEFVEKGIEAYQNHLKEQKRKQLEKLALQFNMQLVPA
ncbi:IS110 family transposase [Mucilaginibacter sp. cycad4]|uniref:IS110 family transposase n=1 Tax=Mucilaginibacter sp. cycad4 TaxID=3342096 RepID=UPI002AAB8FC9|nr:IS110 family transposase [Mucilaginibacter gossypii]WPU97748.1 IS110 family transposase [Mucilaginibacter gossypii]WPU99823.1 IS110 family transposase [Mucilaginibacter gossypii]WPV00096.1 IS110 family transposase [Mucilaginibacter gossypii]WPV00129.1 IS110 family transposase [Mucilaginibacter gossypii]WPV00341.1 IS110 family transposase [Mucilaginibacter gossypii]